MRARLGLLTALLLAGALGACEAKDPASAGDGPGTEGGNPDPVRESERARVLELLRASPFPRLELEVDAVPGKGPRASSVAFIEGALAQIAAKPGGVAVVSDQQDLPAKGASGTWTFTELSALAGRTFGNSGAAGTIRMHVLFVDGQYENPNVLGIAWASTHLVIFRDVIEHYCRQDLTSVLNDRVCEASEQGVWLHETGHLLGLVNNGLPMVQPHEEANADRQKHDASDQCIMYWAFEAPSGISLLASRLAGSGSAKLEFDAACQADLAQGRGP
jgi:hypothetical protein